MSDTHENLERPDEEIKGSSDRSFGFVFAVVFLLIAVWPWLFGDGGIRIWAALIVGLLVAVSLIFPRVLAPANRLWMRFGLLLHRIVNPIVMGLIFFTAVTPTGLIMRALGKDPLRLKLDPDAETYWIEREPPGPAPETMTEQF